MQKTILSSALKAAVPLVLGFFGATVAMFWPAYHAAFCNPSLPGLLA